MASSVVERGTGKMNGVAPTISKGQMDVATPAVANPAPLGLSAFALTAFVLSCVNAGFISAPHIVLGLALFYGGIVQIVAGIWDLRNGNTFGATMFCSFGAFWMAFAVILMPAFGIEAAYPKAADLHTALAFFLLGWTIYACIMFPATFKTSVALMGAFAMVVLTLVALTIADFGGGPTFTILGGWLGIIAALGAWYNAMAGLLVSVKSTFRLPVGPMG
jgi:succinate-acetate transporter protein